VGQPDQALTLLLRAQQHYPGDFWVNSYCGQRLHEAHPPRWDEALRFYYAALAIRPQSPGAHLNVAYVLRKEGRFDEAIAAYRQAVRLQPNYSQAHLGLAMALREAGREAESREAFAAAAATYHAALQKGPGDWNLRLRWAIALLDAEEVDEAIAALRQVVQFVPHNAEACYYLGRAYSIRGDDDQAVAAYRKAIESQPAAAEPHNNLGNLLRKHGKLAEAESEYREAIRLRPNLVEAHNNLGNLYKNRGARLDAIAKYREALRIRPKRSTTWVCSCQRWANGPKPKQRYARSSACGQIMPPTSILASSCPSKNAGTRRKPNSGRPYC
jgi:tetratricopeptide (TPR) repeat protein